MSANIVRLLCRNCGSVREGLRGEMCGCGNAYSAWPRGVVPGLSNERGRYDDLLDRLFAELKGQPSLMLLVVLDGPYGNGFSVCGDERFIANVPEWLRRVAHNIQRELDSRRRGATDS
jgi:hypothetical protein